MRSAPLIVPRTVWACHPVIKRIWLMVAPGSDWSRAIKRACLLTWALAGDAKGVLCRGWDVAGRLSTERVRAARCAGRVTFLGAVRADVGLLRGG